GDGGRMITEQRQLVIVGGGPAGLNAAIEARRHGVDTVLIDERPALGGQIYRQPSPGIEITADRNARAGQRLISDFLASGAEPRLSTTVWGGTRTELAVATDGGRSALLRAERIIVATGGYDRPVAFPGWTLPGVLTAGGAHALVQTQRISPGRNVLLAGSGPLLPAFAAQLHRHGVELVAVIEASRRPQILALTRFAFAATHEPRILQAAIGHLGYLRRKRVPFLYSHMLVRVEGETEAERAVVAEADSSGRPRAGTERTFPADAICVGYGFLCSSELTRLLGCAHAYDESAGGWIPVRDEDLRTTVPGVFAAGDGAGVGGAILAAAEGRLAGFTAAADLGHVLQTDLGRRVTLRRDVRRVERIRRSVSSLFGFGEGIYELARSDTIICRCEEVNQAAITAALAAQCGDPNTVKAVTRAGMGYCQGRNCGRQIEELLRRTQGGTPTQRSSFRAR